MPRQLDGWAKRWALVNTEENKVMDEVFVTLSATVPTPQAISIIHNDIKPDNCQFQPDNPDEVTAIFDWDMTTLGDPLVDIATTLSYWPEPFFDQYDMPVALSKTFPSKQFLIEKYAEYSGFSLERIDWYQAFAYWKSAVVAQQLYTRFLNGQSKDERMKKFGSSVKSIGLFAQKILMK